MCYRTWFVLLLAALCLARARAEDWVAQEYTMAEGDLATPTTKWGGEKYARGRAAVLIFQSEHIHEQDCRQPMELKRAFDFDVDYVYAPYGGDCVVDNDRARQMLDGRRWDAIVFWSSESWHNDYARCADDVKFRILSQVAAGTGLVFTNTPPPEVCRKDRQTPPPVSALLGGLGLTGRSARTPAYWDRWPGKWRPKTEEELKARFFTAFQVGKGRVVCFPATPGPGIAVAQDGQWTWHEALPWRLDNRTDHEYMLAEIGRAILVAAGKAPEIEFAETPPALWQPVWGKSKGEAAKWVLNVAGDRREITVSWRLRGVTGQVIAADTKKFPDATGKIECPVTLPDLAAGRYYLDVFVDSPRGRENFGYSGIEVAAPVKVTLERDKSAVEPGSPLKGSVSIAAAEGDAAPAASVLLKLIDQSDRILDQKQIAPKPGEKTPFAFDTDTQYPMQVYVQADALADGRLAGSDFIAVNLLQRRHDRFNVVLWGNANGPYAHWAQRKLWRTGVTSCMTTGIEQANMNRTPFVVCWGGWAGEVNGKKFDGLSVEPKPDDTGTPVMQPCCWNDAPNFEKMLALQDKHWKAGMESAAYVYNMYDEGPHAGCCLHPACLNAYREWLKEQYGGKLEALNREWGSEYKSWDDVTVLEKNDNHEAKAREKGVFARWSDRKHFAEVNFCRQILGGQLRRARLIDPQARVGFEGSGEFGMDFDELLAPDHTGFWCPYDGVTTEMVRSLKQPGYIHAFWIGYQLEADPLIGGARRIIPRTRSCSTIASSRCGAAWAIC
ncbi:MAG: beta-galactosidase [Planctomycetota bacterium]|nr:beta-galactosidase [Planctomycetota bacterium]